MLALLGDLGRHLRVRSVRNFLVWRVRIFTWNLLHCPQQDAQSAHSWRWMCLWLGEDALDAQDDMPSFDVAAGSRAGTCPPRGMYRGIERKPRTMLRGTRRRARAQTRLPAEVRQQLLDAVYAGRPFRAAVRHLRNRCVRWTVGSPPGWFSCDQTNPVGVAPQAGVAAMRGQSEVSSSVRPWRSSTSPFVQAASLQSVCDGSGLGL